MLRWLLIIFTAARVGVALERSSISTTVRVPILPVVSNSRSNCFADLERDTQVDYQSDISSEYLNIVFTNIRSRGKLTENPSRGR